MPSRPRRPRPRHRGGALVGVLALAVSLVPLLPTAIARSAVVGATTAGPSAPDDTRTARAGQGRVTPAMAREIERVVAGGTSIPPGSRASASTLVTSQVRCARLERQRYCLGLGWTQQSEDEVRARLTAALTTRRTTAAETTGDRPLAATLQRLAARTPDERIAGDRAELTEAARSVAKVWLLRHQVQGDALPAGFLDRHPEVRTGTAKRRYPVGARLMKGFRTREQRQSWWCGPSTMQMIAWGWTKDRRSQRYWADRLGTTTDGSAISAITRTVNRATGYDSRGRAGPYVVLDISDFSFRQWMRLAKKHIADYRAPLVLHPELLARFYPYLDDDASGHFQVGRGYRSAPGRAKRISFFEPWNQQRFDPSEPYVERVQWRSAYRSYRANLAHDQQNIGV